MGGAVDDVELLLGGGCPPVELLAVPQRACLAAGDDQQGLGQKGVDPVEAVEPCREDLADINILLGAVGYWPRGVR